MNRRALLGGITVVTALGQAGAANATRARTAHIVVVGNSFVGKTWAAISFIENRTGDLTPSPAAETYSGSPQYRFPLNLTITVLNGADGYERIRQLSYPTADAFILAYAMNRPSTLDAITAKWRPEILSHAPDARMILVGMKSDLWSPSNPDVVSPRAIMDVEALFPASAMCSAITQAGLRDAFMGAVDLIETFELEPLPQTPMRAPVRRRFGL